MLFTKYIFQVMPISWIQL